MSKLSNLIEMHQTGRAKYVMQAFSPLTEITEDQVRVNYGVKMEYCLGVNMVVKGYADADNGAEIQQMKDMCKRQILHEVFGEFQPLIRRVERAIYEMDFAGAKAAMAELDNEMRW